MAFALIPLIIKNKLHAGPSPLNALVTVLVIKGGGVANGHHMPALSDT